MTDEEIRTARGSKVSRREFLRRVGISTGGAVMAGLSLASACQSGGTTPSSTTGTSPVIQSSSSLASTTPVSPASTTGSTTSNTSATSSTTTASTTTPEVYTYDPPAEMPPLIEVPNSSCRIATDRVYSIEHVWVKSLESDIVAMGITTTMVEILAEPYKIALPPIGLTVKRDDIFGEIEGYKLRADLLAPVGGTVIQTNDFLKAFSGAAFIGPIESDPYVSGWMVVFKLSNPAELGDLLSPESYRQRVKPDPTES